MLQADRYRKHGVNSKGDGLRPAIIRAGTLSNDTILHLFLCPSLLLGPIPHLGSTVRFL